MRISDFPFVFEVQEVYLNLRKEGKNRSEATLELCRFYSKEIGIGNEDDGLLFWIGLADAQCFYGELSSDVAAQGMCALDALLLAFEGISPGDITLRKEKYSKAPMPEHQLRKVSKGFRCNWKIGDTFAYKLSGEQAEAVGISGQYVLFRKLSDMVFGKGKVFPVVSISFCPTLPLPTDTLSFARCPLLKLDRGRMGNSRDMFEYRTELIIENEAQLHRIPFIYLGNFLDISMPTDEVIIDHPGKIIMTDLNSLDKEIAIYIKKSHQYDQEKSKVFGT